MEVRMKKILSALVVGLGIAAGVGGLSVYAADEDDNPAALARGMQGAKATLQAGEREGKPISAKFEIEDGKLQLSVYAATANGFVEALLDPSSAAVVKVEKITGGEDLTEANAQSGSLAT